jgi:oligosaccharyltransferase complex subunit delta (ribophorin II)
VQVYVTNGFAKYPVLQRAGCACKRQRADYAQVEVTLSAADRAVASPRAAYEGLKPEILHQHRKPDKRPPAAVAYAFAGLVVAELAALLLALTRHPAVNFAAWPKAGSGAAIACVAFHIGMAAVMGLYLVFWVQLSILQLLPPLAALGLFTVIAGHQALSALARERLKSA